MDLFVIGTIVVVFLLLLVASLLVFNKMPKPKTYEEAQAEKKLLAEQMKQSRAANRKVSSNSGSGGGGKAKAAIKTKKAAAPKPKDSPKSDPEVHVEFIEEEIISDDSLPPIKKSLSSNTLSKSKLKKSRPSKSPSGSGILVNKNDLIMVKRTVDVAEKPANHFEKIHPKDDVEMLRQNSKDEVIDKNNRPVTAAAAVPTVVAAVVTSDGGNKGGKANLANGKEGKEKKVKPIKEKKAAVFNLDDVEDVQQIVNANNQKLAKEVTNTKKRLNTVVPLKARNEGAFLKKIVDETDEVSVNFLIMLLSKAMLSRSEIQLVIDYLLNKQSDTFVDHSEWTEGKADVVQKLKKQLSDKEKQLQDEQEAMVTIQAKLKELRQELNYEKSHNNAHLKAYLKEIADKDKDIAQLTNEVQKLTSSQTENSDNLITIQNLKTQMIQDKNVIEYQIQQKTEALNILQNKFEHLQKFSAEQQQQHLLIIETITQEKDATIKNLNDQLFNMGNELKVKIIEVEQAKKNEDQCKVSMRNLQNDLDSAKKKNSSNDEQIKALQDNLSRQNQMYTSSSDELKGAKEQVSELNAKISSLLSDKDTRLVESEQEVKQLKDVEKSLSNQIEELKQKNNELRTKNWKLNEALQKAESKHIAAAVAPNRDSAVNNNLDSVELSVQQETELREKFTHLLSQISVFSNLKTATNVIKTSNSNNNSNHNTNNSKSNNDAAETTEVWLERVGAEMKKAFDAYERTVRQQVEESREKELLSSSNNSISSSNNKLINNNNFSNNNGSSIPTIKVEDDNGPTNGTSDAGGVELKNGNGTGGEPVINVDEVA